MSINGSSGSCHPRRDAELIPICNRLLTDLHVVRKMKLLFLFTLFVISRDAELIPICNRLLTDLHVVRKMKRSNQCKQFFKREKEREFKYMLGKAEGADSGCT